jgi:hypothetical protein
MTTCVSGTPDAISVTGLTFTIVLESDEYALSSGFWRMNMRIHPDYQMIIKSRL